MVWIRALHRDLLAEDAHRLRAVDDPPRERALGRVADEHDAASPRPRLCFRWWRTRPPVHMPDPAMITAPPLIRLMAIDSAVSRVKCSSGKPKRIAPPANSSPAFRVVAFRVAPEDLGRGDRHRRIEEHRHGGGSRALLHALAQVEEDLLRAFEREGRDDDVAAAA